MIGRISIEKRFMPGVFCLVQNLLSLTWSESLVIFCKWWETPVFGKSSFIFLIFTLKTSLILGGEITFAENTCLIYQVFDHVTLCDMYLSQSDFYYKLSTDSCCTTTKGVNLISYHGLKYFLISVISTDKWKWVEKLHFASVFLLLRFLQWPNRPNTRKRVTIFDFFLYLAILVC